MIETTDEAITPIIFIDQHFFDFDFVGWISSGNVARR